MQHSALTEREMFEHIRVIQMSGVRPWVRVSHNSPVALSRALDAGAAGIIVPQVVDVYDARRAVNSIVSPIRSTGLFRSREYGRTNFENSRAKLVIQIEHIQAVEQIERLVGVEGVDGFLVGPYDLSASMDKTGQFDSKEFIRAMEFVDNFVTQTDKLAGIHIPLPRDYQKAVEALKKGYDFVAIGMDTSWLWDQAVFIQRELRQYERGNNNG